MWDTETRRQTAVLYCLPKEGKAPPRLRGPACRYAYLSGRKAWRSKVWETHGTHATAIPPIRDALAPPAGTHTAAVGKPNAPTMPMRARSVSYAAAAETEKQAVLHLHRVKNPRMGLGDSNRI